MRAWNLQALAASTCAFDVFTINNAANLPDSPAAGAVVSDYDFQIVQLSMRSFFHDDMLTKLPYADIGAHEKALDDATQRMAFQLSCSMKWNLAHGLLTFVANFPLPQRNVFGVLFPRFEIRNPEHFVYLLNERLESLVRSYRNAYILNMDRISASFGRRFIQDDIISTISHNSTIGTDATNWNRIEPMASMMEHYDITWSRFLGDSVWAEVLLMYRVVRQSDQVKLVMVDLDDTLWHSTSGDTDHADGLMLAGWPEGLVEALVYLKKRGILLAIVSKNEESLIRAIWPRIFGARLSLDDFSAVRINWRPKAENISEVLSLVNLLPRSVVFIDDNPAERAAVQGAFPDIRVLGRNPYYLRRILLWSSETQNISISEESGRRTEMVRAQILREDTRTTLSREAFLAAAAPRIEIGVIEDTNHPRFARAFELINKTNQFNTTGKRWTTEEMGRFFSAGGSGFVFQVADAFTDYGLVGVVLVQGRDITQWVMSCRVLGLDIEIAVMAQVVARIRAGGPGDITGALVATDANFPCRDLFQKCGFFTNGSSWTLTDGAAISNPSHVTIVQMQ